MDREAARDIMFEGTGEAQDDDRRSVVLVGLMGAGKSTVGRRLAQRLNLRFVDADDEIEAAAGMSIPEIFDRYGEAHFRDGERRVIGRLLREPRQVIATGGGAFMNDETRALISAEATSIWLTWTRWRGAVRSGPTARCCAAATSARSLPG